MTTTTFVNGSTLTDEDWFNDVDFLVYDIFGDSTTTASAAARLATAFVNLTVGGTLSVSASSVFANATFANATVGGTLSVSAGSVFAAIQVNGIASVSSVAGYVVSTQALLEAATANDTLASPGRLHFHPGVAKCWTRFDGSATSVTSGASYAISAITDGGTGIYTVNFSTAFSANAAYAPQVSSSADITKLRSVSAGSATILTTGRLGTAEDATVVSFVAFGDFA